MFSRANLSQAGKSLTLNPMKTFRFILVLLLCLAVPAAGWTSVMSGPLCPTLHHHHEASEHATQHAHADHDAQDCGDDLAGGPCKGDQCDCGCGTGACSASQLPLMAFSANDFLPLADKDRLPHSNPPAFVAVRGSSLLRPPIT